MPLGQAHRVPADFRLKPRAAFGGLFILSARFDKVSAEQALADKRGEPPAASP